ncbi:MAG: ABC transporter permease subunit [Lachnospira sp.]|nr:ABC transporter permease subunit [Lachnospira sp.]
MQNKFRTIALRILIIAAWLVVWQVASMMTGLELLLASPVSVFRALGKLVITKTFYITIINSFLKIMAGFMVALVTSVILGVFSARYRIIEEILRPPVQLMKTLPMTSFIILLLIWFGSANVAAYISFIVVFPFGYVAVITGIRQTEVALLEMAKVFKVSTIRKLRCIYVPKIYPFLESSLKNAMGMCWKAGVSAEVIGLVRYSIGEQLYYSKLYLMTAELFAWSIIVVVVSMIFEMLFLRLLNITVALLRKV